MTNSSYDDYVYLDWAATAPLSEQASQALQPYILPGQLNVAVGANANSLHGPGRAAFAKLEQARRSLAINIGAQRPSEVIFTSGSTEANNMALKGILEATLATRSAELKDKKPLIVTSALEHDAVLKPLKKLARQGIEVVELTPSKQGFIEADSLRDALGSAPDTVPVLVSIQTANSEIGSIQPISELVKAAHDVGAFFHTDATQALGKLAFDCNDLGVDAASFSAHKIGGPKGIGALFLRARTPFQTQLLGGGQEEGRRSTTQNVAGAVGFAAACDEVMASRDFEIARECQLRDWLYEQLVSLPGVQAVVLPPEGSMDYLPHIITVMVEGFESETLILRLDNEGFGVSGGSACSSHSLEASHVLRALGINPDLARGELRISIGNLTTQEDLKRFVTALELCLS